MDLPVIDECNQRFMAFMTALDIAANDPDEIKQGDVEYFSQVFSELWEAGETTLCSVLWSNLCKNEKLFIRSHQYTETTVVKMSKWIHSLSVVEDDCTEG